MVYSRDKEGIKIYLFVYWHLAFKAQLVGGLDIGGMVQRNLSLVANLEFPKIGEAFGIIYGSTSPHYRD